MHINTGEADDERQYLPGADYLHVTRGCSAISSHLQKRYNLRQEGGAVEVGYNIGHTLQRSHLDAHLLLSYQGLKLWEQVELEG